MGMTWQPVNPELHEPRRTEILNADGQATSVEDDKYSGVNVSSYYFELDTMLDLGFKGMGELKSKQHVAFFMLEIACYTNTVLVQSIETRSLALERRGLAVRVGIANWGIEFKAASTLAAVAANAQLNLSSTALEVVASGRSPEILKLAQPIVQLTGFNANALKTISECTAKLADFFESSGKTVPPVPLHVAPLDVGQFDWVNTLYSGQFAVESIFRLRSADASLNHAALKPDIGKYVVPGYVHSVYASLGIPNGDEAPDAEQKEVARAMLNAGRY